MRFEADITARASLAAALWCSPVLASVRLEPNRPCIHLGTDINSPSTAPVVLRVLQTLNYVVLERTVARFQFSLVNLIENSLGVGCCRQQHDYIQLIGHQCITNHGVVDSFSCGGTWNPADLRSNLTISLFISLSFVLTNTKYKGGKKKQVTTDTVSCLK